MKTVIVRLKLFNIMVHSGHTVSVVFYMVNLTCYFIYLRLLFVVLLKHEYWERKLFIELKNNSSFGRVKVFAELTVSTWLIMDVDRLAKEELKRWSSNFEGSAR